MKNSKKAFLRSILALVLCVSMFVGTTFAWFTDEVVSMNNIIQTGILDVELQWFDEAAGTWKDVDQSTNVFAEDALWEPGYTEVVYLRIRNAGTLALKYQLGIRVASQTQGTNVYDETFLLSDYIHMGVATENIGANSFYADREAARAAITTSNSLTSGKTVTGEMLKDEADEYFALVVYMPESVGNEANYKVGTTQPTINLGVTLLATQMTAESDSFGTDYDTNAAFPVLKPGNVTVPVTPGADNRLTEDVTMTNQEGTISAIVPAGTLLESGTTSLNFSVSELSATASNVVLKENEVLRSMDVHIEGVSTQNDKPIQITIKEAAMPGLNIGNYALYHVENGATNEMTDGALNAHNGFAYDPATGDITLSIATFSEIAMSADTTKAWEGKVDHSWYNADATELTIANADQLWSFSQIVGGMAEGIDIDDFAGKTVKLIADINLDDVEDDGKIFYPIGYNSDDGKYDKTGVAVTTGFYNFCGTFDGNGHTISHLYQNTWEMKGDNNYYDATLQYFRDGMGLFGKVYGGTVKNLTVDNFKSDGEYTTTGVIAAYADGATFENIAITNCNPRVYNIGNGGIVGCVGWYAKEAGLKTKFTNITVDNTNTISALWGSYDVACGGILGQYYPTSGQTSAEKPANGGVHFENCHISAQLDVYNDVCGNYQYYAYRYAGMLIGSVRENVTIDGHSYPKMDGITASGCTVHFGTWNDYYYCEFEKNGHPSYSGPDDYKFSRVPHSELNFTDSNGNGIIDTDKEKESVTGCKHNHTAAENNRAIHLPFNNLVTGYGWGVTTKVVGELEGVTILDRLEGNSVDKFAAKNDVTTVSNDVAIRLDSLFTENTEKTREVEILLPALIVSVMNLDDDGTVAIESFYRGATWGESTITLSGTGRVKITVQDYYFCNATSIEVTVGERQAKEKFEVVMNNGDFLHRVGNDGTVALDKLFKAKDGVTVGTVSVTIDAVDGTSASGTYSNNAIQFSGTGVVKVTIKDDDTYCTPTVLYLEVVDAVNAISATSAISNNVVLLDDSSVGSITISNGYAVYGNGFKINFNGDGSYRSAAVSYGFVTIENGVLDNAQIICKIFPQAYLFASEMKAGSDGRYPYGYSAIVISGNSTISNSYIYGARNNIQVGNGNVTIQNTVTECGSLSNIHITSMEGNTVVLDNVSTIQRQVIDDFGVGNTMLGFGILVGDNETTTYPTIKIAGDLRQYNWVSQADASKVSNTYAKQAINGAINNSNYKHTLDGVSKINFGMVFLTTKETDIQDDRTASVKEQVPYLLNQISMSGYTGQVYSVQAGSQVTVDSRYDANTDGVIPYVPNAQRVIAPQVSHTGINGSSLTINTAYNKTWVTTFTADLDNTTGGSYSFTFDELVIKKHGKELAYTIKDSSGNTVDKSMVITLDQLYTGEYTLVVIDDAIYNNNGQLSGETKTHEMPFVLYATKTSIDPPTFIGIGSGVDGAIRLVSSSGGNWRPAYPALQGVSVKYWSASEKQMKTVDLSTLTELGIISGQTWTYTCEDFTLKITGGPVHTTTSYVLSPMIATRDGEKVLYFAAANKDNSTGTTARLICLEYVFTDKNASTTVGQCTKYSNGIATVQYANLPEFSWSSFQNGNVEEVSSGGGGGTCVTGDTLVTLADGTQKRVDQITYQDQLLVWNFFEGKYTVVPAALIVNHGYGDRTVIKLTFDDGTIVKAITAHSYLDAATQKWELIDANNAESYIGHAFVQANGDSYTTAKLVDVEVYQEYTQSYSLVSAYHYNFITENMFSLTNSVHNMLAGLVINENMIYDKGTLENDLAKYGKYTYADFADYITYEQYVAFNGDYLKVSVGKGYITFDAILALINEYL